MSPHREPEMPKDIKIKSYRPKLFIAVMIGAIVGTSAGYVFCSTKQYPNEITWRFYKR